MGTDLALSQEVRSTPRLAGSSRASPCPLHLHGLLDLPGPISARLKLIKEVRGKVPLGRRGRGYMNEKR